MKKFLFLLALVWTAALTACWAELQPSWPTAFEPLDSRVHDWSDRSAGSAPQLTIPGQLFYRLPYVNADGETVISENVSGVPGAPEDAQSVGAASKRLRLYSSAASVWLYLPTTGGAVEALTLCRVNGDWEDEGEFIPLMTARNPGLGEYLPFFIDPGLRTGNFAVTIDYADGESATLCFIVQTEVAP